MTRHHKVISQASTADNEAFDLRVIVENSLPHEKSGKNIIIRCPFHQDDHPSMIVNEHTVYCFACGKLWKSYEFLRAIGLKDFAHKPRGKQTTERKRDRSRVVRSGLVEVAHRVLLNNKPALSYLTKERCLSEDIIKKYKIGYIMPPVRGCTQPRFSFPVWDHTGRLATVSFRQDPHRTYQDSGHDAKKYLLYPGTSVTLYNFHMVRRYDWMVYVGGQIDALSLLQFRLPVIGALGEGTFKAEWAHIIGNKKVYIWLDHDEAGLTGANKVANYLLNSHVVRWTDEYPNKYDINSAICDSRVGIEQIISILRLNGADL